MNNSIAWRASIDRRAAASEILKSSTVTQMLATLDLDHPAKVRVPMKDGFDATYRVGFIEGYEHCLSLLRSLGDNPPAPPRTIPSTFGVEDAKQ